MLTTIWYSWFAWHPVRVNEQWTWLRIVDRRDCEDMGGAWTELRARTPQHFKQGELRRDSFASALLARLHLMLPGLFILALPGLLFLIFRHLFSESSGQTAGAMIWIAGVTGLGIVDAAIDEWRYWKKHCPGQASSVAK